MTRHSDILRAARGLIAEPGHWAQHGAAFEDEFRVYPLNPRANRFCSGGALDRACPENQPAAWQAHLLLLKQIGKACCLACWNDHPDRTHGEVLAAFDAAIALAEREEKP